MDLTLQDLRPRDMMWYNVTGYHRTIENRGLQGVHFYILYFPVLSSDIISPTKDPLYFCKFLILRTAFLWSRRLSPPFPCDSLAVSATRGRVHEQRTPFLYFVRESTYLTVIVDWLSSWNIFQFWHWTGSHQAIQDLFVGMPSNSYIDLNVLNCQVIPL